VSASARSDVSAWDDRALVTAMSLVPNFFSRNRMPEFFADPRVLRARGRARLLRSIARDLRSSHRVTDLVLEPREGGALLKYVRPDVFLSRAVEIAAYEVVVLRQLLVDHGRDALGEDPHDRANVEAWLSGLMKIGA